MGIACGNRLFHSLTAIMLVGFLLLSGGSRVGAKEPVVGTDPTVKILPVSEAAGDVKPQETTDTTEAIEPVKAAVTGQTAQSGVIRDILPMQPVVRVKDIARFQGVRGNQLVGLGLVVGLDGTGDRQGASVQMVANMLEKFGVGVETKALRTKNVAAVMVTADLPPFARAGSRLDVTVSSIGDAKSLQGGFLLQTPLQGADNNIYAVAQGPVSIGGFNVRSQREKAQKNHPTVGRVPEGAIVEREVPTALLGVDEGRLTLVLEQADFTTAYRVTSCLNEIFGPQTARAIDNTAIELVVPAAYRDNVIEFIAAVEEVEVTPDVAARVVVNERTGTIVIGNSVRIGAVAVAHGNLSVEIRAQTNVVQPPSFSQGETVEVVDTDIAVKEEKGQLMVLPASNTIGDLVKALNAIGATPRDIIAILQAIKEAGALYGVLEII